MYLAMAILLPIIAWQATLPASAQVDIGKVIAGARQAIVIAIPPFQPQGGGVQNNPEMADVIANDLKLSGVFAPPQNMQFAMETNKLDLAKNTINYAEWLRIGALYLVKGSTTIEGHDLDVTVKVYDTAGQSYVFGKRYPKLYRTDQARELAHQISNDIMERLTGEPGVAGTRILFVRCNDRYGKSKQICVMDADGANNHPLTKEGELVATPCWGMHGTEVYYTTWGDWNPDMRGLILRSGATWWISRRPSLNISPAWSEKQHLIVATLGKDGPSEIYTMNREGKELRRLTTDHSIKSSPCWSPDGSKIAFTSNRTGNPQIHLLDVATLNISRLTYQGNYNDGASWACGGAKKIAYSSRVDGVFQIFTINPDGTDCQQITNGSSDSVDPRWAPNGWVMVFASNRSGDYQLYTMFADGSNVQQLTHGAPSQSPDWGPAVQ
jgi:TolB protein